MQSSSHESSQSDLKWYRKPHVVTCLLLLLLAFMPLAAYWSTLDNYFLNSDFAHIQYASNALQHPELFLKEFSRSWLGAGEFELFYRPLPLYLLAFNLITSGINPFGFHLTSLVLHILCVWCVFFFTIEYLQWSVSTGVTDGAAVGNRERTITAFVAAALFSLYPVTAETITWIGGRPDCAAGLFYIITLIFWFKEQRTGKLKYGLLSMVSYLVALLFKEMPATLVLILPLLCLMKPLELKEKLVYSLRASWKLVVVLALYLLMRWLALGTILGGYKGVFWKLLGTDEYLFRWTHPDHLQKLIFPFNIDLSFPVPMYLIFSCLYVLSIIIILSRYKKPKPLLTLGSFCLVWFLICLVPGLRTSALTNSLASGRSLYIACVPFSLLLAVLLTQPKDELPTRRFVSYVTAAGFVICFFVCDIFNNQVWNEAAETTRSLQLQLAKLIRDTSSDIQVMVLNPPLILKGPYGLNQSLLPVTQTQPFMPESSFDRVIILDREHFVERDANLINATTLRQDMLTACVVAKWNPDDKTLTAIQLIPDMMPIALHNVSVIEEESGSPDFKTFQIVVDPSLIPLSCEAVEVQFQCEGTVKPGFATVSWRDDWRNSSDDNYDTDVYMGVIGDAKMHSYRFPLAEQVGWYLQPSIQTLHLTIHNEKNIKNVSASLASDAYYVPRLRPDMRYLMPSETGLVPRANEVVLLCDTEVPGATGLAFELSQVNECFETYTRTYRDTSPSPYASKRWRADETSSAFRIPAADLRPGFWCVRAASLDRDKRIVGAFGDPVVFRIKSPL